MAAVVPEPPVAITAGWSSTVPAWVRRHSKSATPVAVNEQVVVGPTRLACHESFV